MVRLWRLSSLHLCSLPFSGSPTVLVPFLKTANVHGEADLCFLALNGAHLQPPRHIWISHFLPPPRRKSDGEKRKCLLNTEITHSCEDSLPTIKVRLGLSLLMHLLLIPIPSFRTSQGAGVCSVLIDDSVIPLKYLSGLNNIQSLAIKLAKLLRTSPSLLADVGLALWHITQWLQASFKRRIHSPDQGSYKLSIWGLACFTPVRM